MTQTQTERLVPASSHRAHGSTPLDTETTKAEPVGRDEPAGDAAWPPSDLASRRSPIGNLRQSAGTAASTSRHPQESPDMFDIASVTVHAPGEPRRPSKLITDLAAAMRSTAITAREQAIAQVEQEASQAEAAIRARSTDGAEALRHRADEDINAIREWSKAEIARIRAEAEARIGERKSTLDAELAAEAEAIEQRVFDVHGAVAAYQDQMTAFFERLLREDDPARLATMAETMPDAPNLAAWVAPDPVDLAELDASPDHAQATEATAADSLAEADLTPDADVAPPMATEAVGVDTADGAAAFAADEDLPSPDGEDTSSEDERSLAARLASFLPRRTETAAEVEASSTRVVVTGLVSVASIASFKRQLGRIEGITAVSVSSGPRGEFVFTASHRADLKVADAIPDLQGFTTSVTAVDDGAVFVTARDPEAES